MSVRAMRVNANLTQEQVAKALNITTLSYRNKEKGRIDFKLKELLILCDLFNVPLEAFRKE